MSFFKPYILVLLFVGSLLSQPSGQIAGTIIDAQSSAPLAGAEIFLPQLQRSTVSDAQGRFNIDRLALGPQIIKVYFVGYKDYQSSILVNSAKSSIQIRLHPQIDSTSSIQITAARDAALELMLPARYTKWTIDSLGGKGQLALDEVLKQNSAILIKSYGGPGQLQTISLRGMSAEQTQLLLDGMPLNNLQLGSADLGQFQISNLSAVEIYNGGNALFGGSGAIGGAINLRSLPPAGRLQFSAQASLASFNNSDFNLSADIPFGVIRQRLYLDRQSGENNYSTLYQGKRIKLQNRDFERRQIVHQLAYSPNPYWKFSTYISAYQNESGAAGAFLNPLTESTNQARYRMDNQLAKIELGYRASRGELSLRSWLRNEKQIYTDPTLLINGMGLRSVHKNRDGSAQLQGRYLLTPKQLILGGVEFNLQGINSSEAGIHNRRHFASYMLHDWQLPPFKGLHLLLKLRAEYDSVFGSIFLPGLGMRYQHRDNEFYFSMGKNYRSPSFNDLYWVPGGNPELKPEQAVNAELGGHLQKSFKFIELSISGGLFQNRVRNQIKWLSQGTIWQPQNILQVRSRGLELDLKLADAADVQQMRFGYQLQKVQKTAAEFPDDNTVGHQIPFIPGEQWHVRTQTGYKNWRLGLGGNGMSFRYLNLQNENDQVLPAHTVWQIWSSWHFKLRKLLLGWSVKVNNLLDRHYQVMPGYPMPPRNYGTRISLKF